MIDEGQTISKVIIGSPVLVHFEVSYFYLALDSTPLNRKL